MGPMVYLRQNNIDFERKHEWMHPKVLANIENLTKTYQFEIGAGNYLARTVGFPFPFFV